MLNNYVTLLHQHNLKLLEDCANLQDHITEIENEYDYLRALCEACKLFDYVAPEVLTKPNPRTKDWIKQQHALSLSKLHPESD